MSNEVKVNLSLRRDDAVTVLQSLDHQLQVLRNLPVEEGSDAWAASVRERMALFLVKLALEASL